MSFVFDEKNATNSLGETSWASGNKTTFKENFKASYDAMFASDRFDSERNSIDKEYSLLTDFLNKNWFEIINWWQSEEIQSTRENFIKKYSIQGNLEVIKKMANYLN